MPKKIPGVWGNGSQMITVKTPKTQEKRKPKLRFTSNQYNVLVPTETKFLTAIFSSDFASNPGVLLGMALKRHKPSCRSYRRFFPHLGGASPPTAASRPLTCQSMPTANFNKAYNHNFWGTYIPVRNNGTYPVGVRNIFPAV